MVQGTAVSINDYANDALRLMLRRNEAYLRVLDGDKTIGYVYRQDLLACSQQLLETQDVRDFMAPLLVV